MPDYEIKMYDPRWTIQAKVAAALTVYCGQLISLDSNGEWILADQDGAVPADAVAFKDAVAGQMLTGCLMARLHGDFSGLTVGTTIELSDTAGAFQTSTGVHQQVGLCLSATQVLIHIMPTYSVS